MRFMSKVMSPPSSLPSRRANIAGPPSNIRVQLLGPVLACSFVHNTANFNILLNPLATDVTVVSLCSPMLIIGLDNDFFLPTNSLRYRECIFVE